jgi:hypothetical protein
LLPRNAAILALVTLLLLAPAALADADPASDVLLGESVFYPYSPPVSSSLQATLGAETAAAHKAGFPIRVALIATPVDLGAIPELFGQPRKYAAFLDQEISFGNGRVPLLVVMPNGYGSAGLRSAATAIVASLRKPASAQPNVLAQAAIAAVPKLAAASGHPLGSARSGSGASSSGSGVALPLAILALVCVGLAGAIIAVRRRRARAGRHRRGRTTAPRRR